MKKVVIALALLAGMGTAQAQFKNLLNKAKDKMQQRADSKVDKAMDKALDDLEGNGKKKDPAATTTATPAGTDASPRPEATSGIKAYSKFDFVPGEKVIYTEDFAQDAIGELPVSWNSSGKGEVMTLEGKPEKWVRGHQNNTLLTGNRQKFGENYTLEFDLIFYFNPKEKGYLLPALNFGMFSSGNRDNTDNKWLKYHKDSAALDVALHLGSSSSFTVESNHQRETVFTSDRVPMPEWEKLVNVPMHFSIQVQKTRFRLWRNETKIFDIPRAIAAGDVFNQLYFNMASSNYDDEGIGYYLTNIKVATGAPDTRHKLMEEGRFSTTGILFDFQSAAIRPESYGVIREIATVLKENPALRVNIVGHTSNDGEAKANLELSKQRAAAVKALMLKEYGIEDGRLQTDGKGGTQPIAENKTKEGKLQNRRVEFIKL